MAWWWAASLPNFPCFFSAVMMTVLAVTFPVETVSYFPRCAAAAEVFPFVLTGERLPTIPWCGTTDKRALRAQDFFGPLFHYGRLDLTCINNTDSRQLMSLHSITGATIKHALFLWRNDSPFWILSPVPDMTKTKLHNSHMHLFFPLTKEVSIGWLINHIPLFSSISA